jgi:8-oxo-dGTP diphosphatase
MSDMKHTLRCAVYLFFIRNDKLLLMRRTNTGWKDGEYGVPAGHLEKDESVLQACTREAREEAGVEIDEKDLRFVHVTHRRQNFEYIDFYFAVNKWQGEPIINEKDKADDVDWFPLDSLPTNTVDYVKAGFENYRKGILFSLFDPKQ